jgi:TolB-like protein/tetratricopeptide (TPR) repeat protein
MGVDSPNCVGTQTGAVFLSYASQDAEAAFRMRDALRAGGIEVWLDQSELRGGDSWDRQIRERIHDCRLFIALISAHTEARDEGYFRREWKLAVDRTHDMLEKKAFLLPVAIDATPERGAAVPDKFHEVQWTRLSGGEAPPEFVARIKRLLSPESPTTAGSPAGAASGSAPIPLTRDRPSLSRRAVPVAVAVLVFAALAYLLVNKPWISKSAAPPPASNAASSSGAPPAAFNPPPHSIAVLPFVNMSGDASQEYFSDGLTEEILDSLSRLNELHVAARTSAFSFKGKDADIGMVAHRLNVGAVLEGSVRRSSNTVRVTAQLIDAVTGFHLWSQTYDRDLGDVLRLQTEIATAVAGALKVTLLGDVAARTELGGTHNPAAFDAYLRGINAAGNYRDDNDLVAAIAAYTEAIKLDPGYALAYAGRSMARRQHLDEFGTVAHEGEEVVRADAIKAIDLAPDLAEGHLALAQWLDSFHHDFIKASAEYDRAVTIAPGSAQALRFYALFLAFMGRGEVGVSAARRAVTLDPLGALTRRILGRTLFYSHRYVEAIAALDETTRLDPTDPWAAGVRGLAYYLMSDLTRARGSCEVPSQHYEVRVCRAIVYRRLGRRPAAEAELAGIAAISGNPDDYAYQFAEIHAQWGNTARALEWLETDVRVRGTGLKNVRGDPLLDPLRADPRFQAIERKLNFPK